jgi:hypothetical protein
MPQASSTYIVLIPLIAKLIPNLRALVTTMGAARDGSTDPSAEMAGFTSAHGSHRTVSVKEGASRGFARPHHKGSVEAPARSVASRVAGGDEVPVPTRNTSAFLTTAPVGVPRAVGGSAGLNPTGLVVLPTE